MRPKKKSPPKLPFSDEQIRAKAFNIWQSRGGVGGSAEDDWQKAIQQLKAERHPLRRLNRAFLSSRHSLWNWTGFKEKSLWNWLELLIIPIALAVGTFYLQETADQRDEQIAEDRARQAILASYLDQINTLLIEKQLRNAKPDSEVFILAQARTATALRELDNNRRGLLLAFLFAANLNTPKNKQGLLVGAYLEKIGLRNADLGGVNLSKARLYGADLSKARLWSANLSKANLGGANLSGADLGGANLSRANLWSANLSKARLSGANLNNANLNNANLNNAFLYESDLRNASLYNTDLSKALLWNANLDLARLCNTKLPDGSVSYRDCECIRERNCK